jgi:hypothetical protein
MALRGFYLALWMLAFAALFPAGAAFAQSAAASVAEVYWLRGVEVDRSAATASLAREQAILDGQRLAWRRLLARIAPADGRTALGNLPAAELAGLIDSFEVENERGSGTRWIGAFGFRFRPASVRDLLRARSIAYAETPGRRVLVVPVLVQDGQALLWEEDNLWRTGWASVPPSDGLQPWSVPAGDLDDVALIAADQAAAIDRPRLRALAERSRAQGAIVVAAELDPNAPGGPAVNMQFVRTGAAAPNTDWSATFRLGPRETPEAAWPRLAAAAASLIEERWKAEVSTQGGETALLRAAIPVANLDEWVLVRRRLAEIAAVRQVDLLVLGRGGAIVDIRHEGAIETLRTALALRDMSLGEQDGAWTLSLAGTGTRAP